MHIQIYVYTLMYSYIASDPFCLLYYSLLFFCLVCRLLVCLVCQLLDCFLYQKKKGDMEDQRISANQTPTDHGDAQESEIGYNQISASTTCLYSFLSQDVVRLTLCRRVVGRKRFSSNNILLLTL